MLGASDAGLKAGFARKRKTGLEEWLCLFLTGFDKSHSADNLVGPNLLSPIFESAVNGENIFQRVLLLAAIASGMCSQKHQSRETFCPQRRRFSHPCQQTF